jgi:hypothetical protein
VANRPCSGSHLLRDHGGQPGSSRRILHLSGRGQHSPLNRCDPNATQQACPLGGQRPTCSPVFIAPLLTSAGVRCNAAFASRPWGFGTLLGPSFWDATRRENLRQRKSGS